jgi:hypothetical protein
MQSANDIDNINYNKEDDKRMSLFYARYEKYLSVCPDSDTYHAYIVCDKIDNVYALFGTYEEPLYWGLKKMFTHEDFYMVWNFVKSQFFENQSYRALKLKNIDDDIQDDENLFNITCLSECAYNDIKKCYQH